MRAKIELIRVDNRLVHGQVGVTWVNALNIDTIVVVDDETAINVFSQKMMKTIANAATILGITVQTEFFDKIFPNFLPMCVTLLCFWLLKKKQVSPIVLIVAIIVLSIVASAIGLL